MEPTRPDYFRPALTAGAVAGLLSAIPFVSAANCVCCLWVVGAAAIAVRLLARTTPVALKAGDGAIVGALTGIVAAIVQTLLSIPLRSFNLDLAQRILDKAGELGGEMPAGLDGFFQGASATLTPGWFLLGLFFSAALFGAFGALGGIVGVSLFAKKAVPPPAPAAPPRGPSDAA